MDGKLKPLKMSVPESADYEWHGLHNGDVPYTSISRHEIHELVKAHAEKLGYDKKGDILGVEWFYFESDGSWCLSAKFHPDVHKDFQEISWQDFLKLTPDDVNDTDVVEIPTTTDRNEKAWELFKILMSNRYDDNIDFLVELSKTATDKFLKQAWDK